MNTLPEDIPAVGWIIPFTAGGFIYIATVTALPDLLKQSTFAQTNYQMLAIILGISIMYMIALFE